MIRVICPACRAKIDAKDHLLGQTRNCPRCSAAVHIAPTPQAEPPATVPAVSSAPEPGGPGQGLPGPVGRADSPTRLVRLNRYLICDRAKVIAAWENNGQGWRLKTDYGFVSAARNRDRIPNQGDFKLVELRMRMEGGDLRLRGIRVYQLARRWALKPLERGDDGICQSIIGPGSLARVQKDAVRQQLGEQLMRTVWGDATAVLDYLANDDYHSPGAGE